MIPDTPTHQIWLGDNPIPDHFREWMRRVAAWSGPGGYRLWRESDLAEVADRLICPELVLDPRVNVGLRADVLRYELLRLFGGTYWDVDFELLRDLRPLMRDGYLHYGDQLPGRPAIGFLASPVGFEFWGCFLRQIQAAAGNATHRRCGEVVGLTGPDAFAKSLQLWVGSWQPDEKIMDAEGLEIGCRYEAAGVIAYYEDVLYPYWYQDHTWKEFSRDDYPRAYAAHHWGASWMG